MSDGREGFKEIIKNNEYNNISLRIINDRKSEGIKNVIDHNKKFKQNISIKIPFSHLNNIFIPKNISTTVLSTNPSNIRLNKITVNKNMIMNKVPITNLNKKPRNLNEIKNYGSSSNLKNDLQKNHTIYISKNKDSTNYNKKYDFTNNEKNHIEANINNNQTVSTNNLSRNNIEKANELYRCIKPPKRKNSLIVNSVGSVGQNNINNNINNNYIYDSNTYRDPNHKNTALKKYNYLTYNARKDKTNNETNQRNNKMLFNNTLTTIIETKSGNIISHRINMKDLQNLKNKNISNVNNSSKGEYFAFNQTKHKSFVSEVPTNPLHRYGSKDSLLEKINLKKNTTIIRLSNINNNKSLNNIIKIPNSLNKNTLDNNAYHRINNIKNSNQNIKYPENEEKININKNIMTNIINNQTSSGKLVEKNNTSKMNSIPHKTNIREINNKSVDNKEIKTPKINSENIAFIRKEFSIRKKNKERELNGYINEKIKEENEEDSSNKSIKEEEKIKKRKKNIKHKHRDNNGNKILFINKRIIYDNSNHSSNKDIIKNIKTEFNEVKHKEPLNSVRKAKGNKLENKINEKLKTLKTKKKDETKNINIQNINNLIEAQNENTDTKNINKLKDDKNPKPQISERIKHILMSKKSDANRAKPNITFTTKKDLKDYFNKELSESKHINDDDSEIKSKNKLKQYNFKNIKNYRLINSLSVKDNLRKHKLNRKLLLGRNFKKYQYNDDDEESLNKDKTKTAKKLNNYTYLELKDIKNIKRDTFITLHSIGGAYTDSRFDDMERSSSLTHMDFKFKEFKPYTVLHPNKKFKRRGLANFRINSERKISGIKIVGNTDSIEYQYDKFNLRSLKRDSLFGKSMKNIHLAKFKEKNWLKRDNSSISLDII